MKCQAHINTDVRTLFMHPTKALSCLGVFVRGRSMLLNSTNPIDVKALLVLYRLNERATSFDLQVVFL